MPPKPPRRTRERILETALQMFNDLGEPSVATTAIAFEMGISPGNLYYHYRSKEAIVTDLFAAFRREIETTLAAPEQRLPNAEDCWLFLHLVFEAIWKYRFIYRDINDLVGRYRGIGAQFRRVLAHKIRVVEQILGGLVKGGQMRAAPVRDHHAGAEHRPGGELLDVVRGRPQSARRRRRTDARPRRLSRHRARRALSRAARTRAFRSTRQTLHRVRSFNGHRSLEKISL